MALSQICDKAMVESQLPGAKTKFLALIDFTQFRPNRYQRTNHKALSKKTPLESDVQTFSGAAKQYVRSEGWLKRVSGN